MTDNARLAALAALTGGEVGAEAPAPSFTATGTVHQAGGDVERTLLVGAGLTWVSDVGLERVDAVAGDTVLVTEQQATRLDSLSATVEATTAAKVPPADGLEDMKADDLIAVLGSQPALAGRIRDLEEARPESQQRKTVLAALDEADQANAGE